MKTIAIIIGTRPEAIKLVPIISQFKKIQTIHTKVIVTAQHRTLLDQVLSFFNIRPDIDLNLMRPNQSLGQLTASLIKELETVFQELKPDLVIVQGDTTTAFAASLAAFYKQIKIAHIEAGLRTYNKQSPFPEEMNRVLISRIANYHFTPTAKAREQLEQEGVHQHIYQVGNTIIDALHLGLEKIEGLEESYLKSFPFLHSNKKTILVTCHRRELFGEKFNEICEAIITIANENKTLQIIFPVHLNPEIHILAHSKLQYPNIHLLAPLPYDELLWIMKQSYLILTDSGGIQEEAPSLGKPVLVLRDSSERMEGIEAGNARLIGTKKEAIVQAVNELLNNKSTYTAMSEVKNPYGDGKSSIKITKILTELLSNSNY